MKKHFNKELLMNKEHNQDFKNSNKCWTCDDDCIDNDAQITDHCHITRKCRGSAHRNRDMNLKLNHKIPVVFYNLKIMIPISLCKN